MGIKIYIKLDAINSNYLQVYRGDDDETIAQYTAQGQQAGEIELFKTGDIGNFLY